jgi:hypothetical protein
MVAMPVTREEVQSMITASINAQLSPFGLAKVPFHTHNGVDSPYAFDALAFYCAYIQSNGTVGFLPNGWVSTYVGTGAYEITHNLNSLLYAVVATPAYPTVDNLAAVISPNYNAFEVHWLNPNNVEQDTPFYFLAVKIKNTITTPVPY